MRPTRVCVEAAAWMAPFIAQAAQPSCANWMQFVPARADVPPAAPLPPPPDRFQRSMFFTRWAPSIMTGATANPSNWRIVTAPAWTWRSATAPAPSAFPPSARGCTDTRWKRRRPSPWTPSHSACEVQSARCTMFYWCCSIRAPTPYTRALPRPALLLQEVLNRLSGLPRPVLILDKSEAYMALAQRPESDSRRDSDQRFFEQQLGKFERAFGAILFGNRRPDEHGALRRRHRPTRALKPGD